jgi:acyl-[acyl-carrier-protein]-phospholipid O-acyltransferase / long-chain-fatty-acid--[acyl-carrier-protein] ligase
MDDRPVRSMMISRWFVPLFVTQFLGAMNGNLVKTAVLFLLVFNTASSGSGGLMSSLAATMFVLPMILFSAFAGALADRYDKATLTRSLKILEGIIVLLVALAFALQSTALMLVTLFLLGCVSAFFGPIKYAILPQHLAYDDVMKATGLVEAGTFVAILAGQIVGGLLSPTFSMLLALCIAIGGVLASRAIPPAPPLATNIGDLQSPLSMTLDVIGGARKSPAIYIPILAISWFWGVGAILTTQLPVLVHGVLNAAPSVATLMLAMFSIGVALGSVLAGRLAIDGNAVRAVAVSAFVMSMALGLFLWLAGVSGTTVMPLDLAGFLQISSAHWMLVSLVLMAGAGGVFIVPLYAMLQLRGEPERRSRDVAANNILNAIFMVAATGAASGLAALGCSSLSILAIVAVVNAFVGMLLLWWTKNKDGRMPVDHKCA